MTSSWRDSGKDCAEPGCIQMAWLARRTDDVFVWFCRKHFVLPEYRPTAITKEKA